MVTQQIHAALTLFLLQQLETKGAEAMTDSTEQQNEKEQHTSIDLGILEEIIRNAGLLRGSGLHQLFTTVGARFVPLVTGVITTEVSPAMLLVAANLSVISCPMPAGTHRVPSHNYLPLR